MSDVEPLVRALGRCGRGATGVVTLSCADGEPVAVPEPLVRVLYDAALLMSKGQEVLVVAARRMLTSTQAAAMLGVSRHEMARLFDSGALPYHRVGSHRRVRYADVSDLRRRWMREAEEAAALNRLDVTGVVLDRR